MESKHALVSDGELLKSSNSLKATKANPRHDSLEYDPAVAERLAATYKKHGGDLKDIFEELDENPRKALKHPPSDANDFGVKYAQGFYTYAEEK
ncbi:hypothetical protein SPRG_16322 [Saprolegnia parasitica CBS 223.65]|uniref:Uncharacterized protein n=1 Tax=Saprolegnia parasitica (strain CBS 223.65) TaxID=695850 RepID=A0A067BIR5_SAPPC|nr:hypothetical protein SPRG_16322 [Saprolegnia parasitica CBS 223.65]KDO18284.1 hypothetical protein SPRG_16322 [Saprolegnia parasitica CBS 223.65]|eukprot:XP_012211010.1 hypothetical protein SPRG_16322 [Saprolegnia parasitica CBS 223.65]